MSDTPRNTNFDHAYSFDEAVAAAARSLALAPCELDFIRIDHQIRLQFPLAEVVIEAPFTLSFDGVDHSLDPAERGDLGPLLALYPDILTALTVYESGTLHLVFGKGARIMVPPDYNFEPWQIVGPGAARVVCLPMGRLAVWR